MKKSSLARAHEMRSMHIDGLSIEEIAVYFKYSPSSIEKLIDWHAKLYQVMPEYDGDTELWKSIRPMFIKTLE